MTVCIHRDGCRRGIDCDVAGQCIDRSPRTTGSEDDQDDDMQESPAATVAVGGASS